MVIKCLSKRKWMELACFVREEKEKKVLKLVPVTF